jgi:hypothetical protein
VRKRNLVSLFAVAAVALVGAPPAALANAPTIEAPSTAYARSPFGVSVTCPDRDWRAVTSDVLVAPIQLRAIDSSRPDWARGTGTIISTARAGTTYTLHYGCGDQVFEHSVRIEQEPPSDTPAELRISPTEGRPGSSVRLQGFCYKVNPHYPFESDALQPAAWISDGINDFHANTTVRRDAKPGVHKVTYYCSGTPATVNFTVLGAAPQPPPPAAQPPGTKAPAGNSPNDQPHGQVVKVPKGAVETGGGPAICPAG